MILSLAPAMKLRPKRATLYSPVVGPVSGNTMFTVGAAKMIRGEERREGEEERRGRRGEERGEGRGEGEVYQWLREQSLRP